MDLSFYLLPIMMIGIGCGAAFLLRLLLTPLRLPEHTILMASIWFGLFCAVAVPALIGSLPWHKKSRREMISEAKMLNGSFRQVLTRVIDEIIKHQSYVNRRHSSDGSSPTAASFDTAQARRLKARLKRCSIQKEDNFHPVLLTCLRATEGFLSAVEGGDPDIGGISWREAVQTLQYIRLRLSSYTNDQPINDPRVQRMIDLSTTV